MRSEDVADGGGSCDAEVPADPMVALLVNLAWGGPFKEFVVIFAGGSFFSV